MAKSSTKRKSAKAPPITEVIAATEATSLYIGVWAKQEAERLLKKEPVIIPLKNGYYVGKFTVKNVSHTWHVYNVFNELINAFSSKQSAVSWCILEHTGRINQSQKLLEQDAKVSKYTQDQTNYRHTRQQAIKRGDYFAVDLSDAKLAKIQSMLEDASNDLEKTLNQAKYLKGIWERPL
jgi:hypothetical protein